MVRCEICLRKFRTINNFHLQKHNVSIQQYKLLYPTSAMTSIETRNKISSVVSGKNNPFFGKTHSSETRKKMRENHWDISGENNPSKRPEVKEKLRILNTGKKHSEETKKKIGNRYYPPVSVETRKKLSKSHKDNSGSKHPLYGIPQTDGQKRMARERRLGMVTPCFNPTACKIIEEYGTQNDYNFQHALNGGECRFIGYSVDGYDKEKNVIVEYYERHHNYPSNKNRDAIRKNNLMNHLSCNFIEIFETGDIVITNYKEIV